METTGKPKFDDVKGHGSRYDNATKLLSADERAELCRWLGATVPSLARVASEDLAANPLRVDYLMHTGKRQLTHVEFERRPTADLGRRMFCYLGRLQERHRGYHIEQFVVVLADGNPPEEWELGGARVRYRVHKLREQDPDSLLARPATAPFAVLACAEPAGRLALLTRVLKAIWDFDYDEGRRKTLVEMAATLAEIYLTFEEVEVAWKESAMLYPMTEGKIYRHVYAEGEDKGRAEERAEMIVAMLEERFGGDPGIVLIAARLSALDRREAYRLVWAAESLDDLR
ncbi:hypothetical protein [Fodinicola feengrottensis]